MYLYLNIYTYLPTYSENVLVHLAHNTITTHIRVDYRSLLRTVFTHRSHTDNCKGIFQFVTYTKQ